MEQEKIKSGQEKLREESSAPRVIPVIHEKLTIDKQVVETGRVHISKTVSVDEVNENIPLLKEEVVIERKPINQYIEESPGIRMDGNTTIIPIIKEVIVKRLLLVEEVYVTKTNKEQLYNVHETLRKEEVKITRSSSTETKQRQ